MARSRVSPDPLGHPVDLEPDPLAAEALDGLRPLPPGRPWDRVAEVGALAGRAPARAVALLVAALAVAAAGWWLLRPPAAPIESALPLASAAAGATDTAAPAAGAGAAGAATSTSTTLDAPPVVVQAAGAVVRGGVYRLPAGSRVDDLVRAAGGLAPDADRDRVNLAAPLTDGERVWVPRTGQVDVPDVVAGGGGGATAAGGRGGSGGGSGPEAPAVVDLNTATADDLDTLPGVGPATAAAILAYRDEHGRFASVDELLEVRGIGEAKLEQLRASVTV